MTKEQNHHFLPIFYLKNWKNENTGELVRYYRPYREVVYTHVSPKGAGYEPGLYSLSNYPHEHRNIIEAQYMSAIVDNEAALAIKVLLEGDKNKLTPELRNAWTRFLLSLLFRTPYKIAEIIQLGAENLRNNLKLNPEEYDAVRNPNDPTTMLEWVEKNAPLIFSNFGKQILPELIQNEKIGNEIIRMSWWTIDLLNGFPTLLTCDNPLYISHGIGNEKCVIALPLSPRFAFFATRNPQTISAIMSQGKGKVIKSLNAIMLSQAQKDVYGSNTQHLKFVENRLTPKS